MRPGQEYWIIRRAGTMEHLPHANTGYRATWVEFTRDAPPRLFESQRAARRCLTYWCRGRIQGAKGIGYRSVADPRRYNHHYLILSVTLQERQSVLGLGPHSIIEHGPSPTIPFDTTPPGGV
jgi:hypothetical protein